MTRLVMLPPRSILTGIDFSESSRTALTFAARMARQFGAALHVLHAEDPLLSAAAKSAGVPLTSQTRDELKQWVDALHFAGPVHYHVVTGGAVGALCNLARREQLDLIVVGMHGMSGAAKVMFGSTTEGVLRQAGTSVFVVPDQWVPPAGDRDDLSGLGPVVAAIECAEPALAAAAAACRLAELLQTDVEFVHIVPELAVPARWQDHADAAVRQAVEQEQQELNAIIPTFESRAPVTLIVKAGPVPEGIAEAVTPSATRRPLLVLGRRNKTSRLGAPGTTAYRVLTRTRVPVLLYLPGR